MKTIVLAGVAAAAICVSGIATAQTAPDAAAPGAQPERHHRIAKPEQRADVQKHVDRMFARLDANHDGYITKDEIAAAETAHQQKAQQEAPKRAAKMFDRLDANHDGQITRAEVDAARNARMSANGGQSPRRASHASRFFDRADANKDGVVTRSEFETAAGSAPHFRHAGFRGLGDRMFSAADTNKDGRVSQAEATQLALQRFDQADLNHDGVLTPDERRQARQSMRGKPRPQ
jgi:Ca2+-binding EF-hand superfamily protein